MQTIVKFRLSEAGRKAALLAGVCADEYQSVEVTAGTPEFGEVVAAGKLSGDTCELDVRYGMDWHTVPSVRQILDEMARRAAEKAAEDQAKKDAALAKVADVFARRALKTTQSWVGYGATEVKFETHAPDWRPLPRPGSDDDAYDAYASELVPECAAWVAELEAANAAAAATATEKSEELKAAKAAWAAAAKEEAAQAESSRRARLGLEDGEFDYAVENGAIMRVPCYDTGRRSKNWMAVITVDPAKPGGLDRDFAEKAHGDAYYMLPDLSPGDALEFGADSYSSRGRKSPERAYRIVVRVEVQNGGGYIVLQNCSTGKEACREGAKLAKLAAKLETVA